MLASTAKIAPPRFFPALAGLLPAVVLLGMSLYLLAGLQRPPADWLLQLSSVAGNEGYGHSPCLLAWLIELVDLDAKSEFMQRAVLVGMDFMALLLLLWALSRRRDFDPQLAFIFLASLSVWSWLQVDPAAFAMAAPHAGFLVLCLGVCLLSLAPRQTLLLLPVVGVLRVLLGGAGNFVIEALFLFWLCPGLQTRASQAEDGSAGGKAKAWSFLACLGYGVGCSLVLFIQTGSVFAANAFDWWQDVDGPAQSWPRLVPTLLLTGLGCYLLFRGDNRDTRRRRSSDIAGYGIVVLALLAALLSWREVRRHDLLIQREQDKLHGLMATVSPFQDSLFINLPLHLRPFVALALQVQGQRQGQWERVCLLDTWDNGGLLKNRGMLFLPEEPACNLHEGSNVLRWTRDGMTRVSWEDCLLSEPFPLAALLMGEDVRFASSPHAMLSLTAQMQSFGVGLLPAGKELRGAGIKSAGMDQGWLRVEGTFRAGSRIALALGSGRAARLSDKGVLKKALSPDCFAPPFALDRVELEGGGAAKLRLVDWLVGYGPVVELGHAGERLVALTFRVRLRAEDKE